MEDIRKTFHQELDEIQSDIVHLGALVAGPAEARRRRV